MQSALLKKVFSLLSIFVSIASKINFSTFLLWFDPLEDHPQHLLYILEY
jgi:hypothetical protein